jgi:hypothetical protein
VIPTRSQNSLFLLLKKNSPKLKSWITASHWKPHFSKWAHLLATRPNRRNSHIQLKVLSTNHFGSRYATLRFTETSNHETLQRQQYYVWGNNT